MKLTKFQYELLDSLTERYPDYPIPGVTFKDLSLIYTSKQAMITIKALILQNLGHLNIDCAIGCDARGFILGTIVAETLGIPLVLARKAGKLPPCELLSKTYKLEYGTAELQMHKHIITKYKSPVICDDVAASGGTMLAITDMLEEVGITPNSYFTISEIVDLNCREKLEKHAPFYSILK